MSISTRFVLDQGPALRGLGETAFSALRQRLGPASTSASRASATKLAMPGPEIHATFPARNPELVRAYVRHVGGDPASYKNRVPAHLFPQWGFALSGKTLAGLPYPMLAAMNGGCRLVQHGPLPLGEELEVSARLQSIDDDGRRAILEQRIVTGTRSSPGAVEAFLQIFIPLGKKGDAQKDKRTDKDKERARVPEDAREIAFFKLRADAGLDFAKLTGDFNPVHWVPAYARAFGFKSTILHGFGTMARAIEGLHRGLFAGDIDALREVQVRFTRPLLLPAKVGLYVRGNDLTVGTAPAGPAFLTGTFSTRHVASERASEGGSDSAPDGASDGQEIDA